ncbi:MAG: adenosylcobinamide-phosphate synthase CbiB [Clostridia bacterium]|nr:adenosylcobinamide-phosphate synthase CbiB [Clostridia bacterium]
MQAAAAYLIDLVVGDPRWLPHPVVVIGKGISLLEGFLRRWAAPLVGLKAAGVLLTSFIVAGSYLVTWAAVEGLALIHPYLGLAVGVWLISTTIAAKGLAQAGLEIRDLLAQGNLAGARIKVGWIVGRDTQNLDEGEITRATVETVAENIVDGIVAPLFYAFIGGAPLAMAYRATNTLDSMVGYKNEKYLDLGWASARFDDLANLIPARLTGIFLVLAAWICGVNGCRAIKIQLRDAAKHPSPNSGYPESAVAGALGIRLGGQNYYGGQPSFRAYMGDALEPLEGRHIGLTVRLMYVTSALMVLAGIAISYQLIAYN